MWTTRRWVMKTQHHLDLQRGAHQGIPSTQKKGEQKSGKGVDGDGKGKGKTKKGGDHSSWNTEEKYPNLDAQIDTISLTLMNNTICPPHEDFLTETWIVPGLCNIVIEGKAQSERYKVKKSGVPYKNPFPPALLDHLSTYSPTPQVKNRHLSKFVKT